MTLKTAYSDKSNTTDAVNQLKGQLGNSPYPLILFFASSFYDQNELCMSLKRAFPDSVLSGCSTSGELHTGKMLKNSVVAMAFPKEIVGDFSLVLVENLSRVQDLSPAVTRFEDHFNESFADMDISSYVGLILFDGLRGAEERIMDRLGDLTNVPFVGGSAGDDLKFETTFVWADDRAVTDAAVLILMKPASGFSILKTQSFSCRDKLLTVTKADTETRTVMEFNHKPAVTAYAQAVGCPESEVDRYFMKNPIGLMVGDEPYVRSPMKTDGKGIVFYCNMPEGMELNLLESGDIVAQTSKDLETLKSKYGKFAGLINFHCILRTLELENQDRTREYGDVFSDIPSIGFSTYGEEYIGHINQTSTMLIFREV